MTIKEIENLSGMTRANIRFYEAEGLLTPMRLANRYREYTEDNLETLKRIRLLRSLRISLEDIKALHTGSRELTDMLDFHLARLQQEKEDIAHSQEICKIMCRDGVSYGTLDAQHYLDILKNSAGQSQDMPVSFETDVIPEVRVPWRRYFARALDLSIYATVWQVLLALVFHVNFVMRSPWGRLLDDVVGVLLMYALEPVLLSCFGTTPGKRIWGLSVTDCEGGRLTYEQARDRTRQVLRQGLGFYLPVYHLIRLWNSYKEKQDWEYRSEIILRDRRGWRIAAYIGAILLLATASHVSSLIAELPVHRGEITVAEFCDNYNYLAEFYGMNSGRPLDSQGRWIEGSFPAYGSDALTPNFRFTEKDGVMTGMEFSVNLTGNEEWIQGYQSEMILSILSFVRAQKKGILFFPETDDLITAISREPFASFDTSAYGVRMVCYIQYSGYYDTGTMLIPDQNPRFSLHFSMQRQ